MEGDRATTLLPGSMTALGSAEIELKRLYAFGVALELFGASSSASPWQMAYGTSQ